MHPNYKLSEEIVNKIMDSYNEELFEIAAKELEIEGPMFSKSLAFSMCLLSEILAALPDKLLTIVYNVFSYMENEKKMVQIFQKTVMGINKLKKESPESKRKEKEDRIFELERIAKDDYIGCIEWVHVFNMLTGDQKEEIRKLHKEVYGSDYPIKLKDE